MKNSPRRKQRRRMVHQKKKGDLNRASTHKMRSKMGMGQTAPAPAETRVEPKITWRTRLVAFLRRLFRIKDVKKSKDVQRELKELGA